ncbi:MAG: glutathione S-transferase family protein [Parvibaculaceae bacterium]
MAKPDYRLIIGSKEGSSWSLRPWILMRCAGIPFEEILIRLRQPDTHAKLLKYSPTGKVPALQHGSRTIWDSLAIAEYLHELHPEKQLWPEDGEARAFARCIAAEMHSSFREMRYGLPMEFSKRHLEATLNDEAKDDVRRVVAIWTEARSRFGQSGPFLLGKFSIADAMYAPVASRFTSFDVDLGAYGDDGTAEAYRKMMMALPAMIEWGEAAAAEKMPRWVPH